MEQGSNARWQRWAVLVQVGLAGLWAAALWRVSPLWALAGVSLVVLGWGLALLPQFVLMARVRTRCGEPHPGVLVLLRAWCTEWLWAVRVFGWWQPFRSQALQDWLPEAPAPGAPPAPRGVVLVHGFLCNRGFWTPWLRRLRARGHAHVALDLEPPFASIDAYAPALDAAVRRVHAATGRAPLVLAHSMGGLVVRAWLRAMPDAQARVHRVVTIGTPHHGTWAARRAIGANGAQMRLNAPWLQRLAGDEPPARRALFVCWRSDCDNAVYPDDAARLAGAQEHAVAGLPHVALAFDARVVRATLALLDEP